MEIKSLVDAHNMLGHVMQNLQNVQLAIATVCKDAPELADEFTACISQMYCQLSEISDFIIDPDVENGDATYHV